MIFKVIACYEESTAPGLQWKYFPWWVSGPYDLTHARKVLKRKAGSAPQVKITFEKNQVEYKPSYEREVPLTMNDLRPDFL